MIANQINTVNRELKIVFSRCANTSGDFVSHSQITIARQPMAES